MSGCQAQAAGRVAQRYGRPRRIHTFAVNDTREAGVVELKISVRPLRILIVVVLIAGAAYAFRGKLLTWFFRSDRPPSAVVGSGLEQIGPGSVEVIAEGLDVPWEIRFLPDGSILVTERAGRLVLLSDGQRASHPVPGVRQTGEGGLMGLALHPDFAQNDLIYVCLTAQGANGLENRVERYRLGSDGPDQRQVIVDGIPGATFHDGCRLEFGPDGLLYITTGDAGGSDRAQDRSSLAGKILRVTAEGEVPGDNPFGSLLYTYGHRNPQGLTWDDAGHLWATEHGRSGLRSGLDELNRIEAGGNYGWPLIEGSETDPGMVTPVLTSGPGYTWAPAGAAYQDGRIFFGGLRSEALYEARIQGDRAPELRVHFHDDFGRIRAVRIGPQGMLYFTTSNRDGRGRPRPGDDKLLRVDPTRFE